LLPVPASQRVDRDPLRAFYEVVLTMLDLDS